MDLDFKLDKVIEIFDLIKRMSWSSIPLWFSLTIPVIYLAYSKLLPERNADNPAPEAASWFKRLLRRLKLPKLDKLIVYSSLALFVIGTITLMIDQNRKEAIRKNGLRMKQYFLSKNNFNIPKGNFINGNIKLLNLDSTDIDNVLEQYPNEFLEVENNTIILRDSIYYNKIIGNCEKLLDSYLSDPAVSVVQDIDELFKIKPGYFPREVVYKLIVDSSNKYSFCILQSGSPGIKKNISLKQEEAGKIHRKSTQSHLQ